MLIYADGKVRLASSWRNDWFEVDEATGLPQVLDEGAFFRVKAAGWKRDEARLKITYRRKRRFWFDKVYGFERYVQSVEGRIVPDHIVEHATLCLVYRRQMIERAEQEAQDRIEDREYRKRLKARKKLDRQERRDRKRVKPVKPKRLPRAERPTGQLKYVGDYPPKSLKEGLDGHQ